MNLVPTNSVLDGLNLNEHNRTCLTNGQFIDHKWYLKGGGDFHLPYFLEAINKYGAKKTYNRCFEWCCGHGRIGWEILTQDISNELTFSDIYDLAVYTGFQNAKKLNYDQVFTGYVTPTISGIPDTEIWDLVVGNPPNAINDGGYVVDPNMPKEMYDLGKRLMIDTDFVAHKEFFANIRPHLTDDADIFITAQLNQKGILEDILTQENFKLVKIVDMFPTDPGLKVMLIKSN